jgi:hypothetical protein
MGRVEVPVRRGYAVSDEVWELLGEAGGNVWELVAAGGEVPVPSMSTLSRVVRRDRWAGRALLTGREPEVAGSRRPDPLSELGLDVVAGKGGGGQVFLRRAEALGAGSGRGAGREGGAYVRCAVGGADGCARGRGGGGGVFVRWRRPGQDRRVAVRPVPAAAPGQGPPGPRRCAPDGSRSAPGTRGRLRAGQASAAWAGEADLMLVNALRQPCVLVLDEA